MSTITPRRSVLYTPGSNPRALAKAVTSAADSLIFDLEDSVAPETKEQARRNVVDFLIRTSRSEREIVVRVNGIGTPWCEQDVREIAGAAPAAVLFPKISSSEDAAMAESLLNSAGAPTEVRLWCMIETPLAILNAQAIAQTRSRAESRLEAFVIGTNDLAKEIGAAEPVDRDVLVPALLMVLLAAKAYGVSILDGVHNDFRDMQGFEAAARQSSVMGFDGKTVIHPDQIEPCNQIFSPSPDAVIHARQVLEAFAHAKGQGVIQVDGKMIELLHVHAARRVLAMVDAVARMNSPNVKPLKGVG